MHSLMVKLFPVLTFFLATGVAGASVMTFETMQDQTLASLPIKATATFITSADKIEIHLVNLQVEPVSVVQNISGLYFTISTGENVGSLVSTTGVERTVNADGTYTDSGPGLVGDWLFDVAGTQIELSALGSGQPQRTIIGPSANPGLYEGVNGSILNASHNPFIAGTATFVLAVPGVTANSSISNVTIGFNTTRTEVPTVPEPMTAGLLAAGTIGVLVRRK